MSDRLPEATEIVAWMRTHGVIKAKVGEFEFVVGVDPKRLPERAHVEPSTPLGAADEEKERRRRYYAKLYRRTVTDEELGRLP